MLAGALLEQANSLIDKGLHPLKIADGFDKACEIAVARLEEIAEDIDIQENNHERWLDKLQKQLQKKNSKYFQVLNWIVM